MKKAVTLFILTLLLLTACSSPTVVVGDTKVKVEIADDDQERARGLMFRESLDENKGMLFIFEDENQRSFWMKNTFIPLDMIFITSDGEIDTIHHAVPCTSDPCRGYPSDGDNVKYVLEVNGGFTERHGISVGDRVQINL